MQTKKAARIALTAMAVTFMTVQANSWCAPGSTEIPNGGHLVPYYEGKQLMGEKCLIDYGVPVCNCIGMIYWY